MSGLKVFHQLAEIQCNSGPALGALKFEILSHLKECGEDLSTKYMCKPENGNHKSNLGGSYQIGRHDFIMGFRTRKRYRFEFQVFH